MNTLKQISMYLPLRLIGVMAAFVALSIPQSARLAASEQSSAAGAAATMDDAKAQAVMRVERDWVDALNSGDIETIARILAEDFRRPSPEDGQFINKSQLLSYYRSPHASRGIGIDDVTVRVYGNTAIARGKVMRADGEGRVAWRALFTDVFIERDGTWQAVSAQENEIGKP